MLNLTSDQIRIYRENQFINLTASALDVWLADKVLGEPVITLESRGIAGVQTLESYDGLIENVPTFRMRKSSIWVTNPEGRIVALDDLRLEKDELVIVPSRCVGSSSKYCLAIVYQLVLDRMSGDVLGCTGVMKL